MRCRIPAGAQSTVFFRLSTLKSNFSFSSNKLQINPKKCLNKSLSLVEVSLVFLPPTPFWNEEATFCKFKIHYFIGGKLIRWSLLEKNSFMGGNSTKATSGMNGALTKTQIKLGIPVSSCLCQIGFAKCTSRLWSKFRPIVGASPTQFSIATFWTAN